MSDYGKQVDETTVRFERLLPGPIERVWSYLTDPKKRAEWFAGGAAEIKKPGLVEFIFDHRNLTTPDDKPPKKHEKHAGEMRFEIRIVKVEAPRLLVWEWQDPDATASEVRIELAPRGGKVLLTLTESKLATRDRLIGNSGGWHAHLDILQAKLEGRTPPPFWTTHTRLEADYGKRFAGAAE